MMKPAAPALLVVVVLYLQSNLHCSEAFQILTASSKRTIVGDDDRNCCVSLTLRATPVNPEVLVPTDDDDDDDELDWMTDAQLAQLRRSQSRRYAERVVDHETTKEDDTTTDEILEPPNKARPSPYTEEEEELIARMGGKDPIPKQQTTTKDDSSSSSTEKKEQPRVRYREEGYLGDSTLQEIAMDYGIPVCYLADVLCMWGVPVPIDIYQTPLGDLVTGEQAFAILEAVNSLDAGALNDRYANVNLQQLCMEEDIQLSEAFAMAMKEGWSLPFGVNTVLRVEQVDELVRVLGSLD